MFAIHLAKIIKKQKIKNVGRTNYNDDKFNTILKLFFSSVLTEITPKYNSNA